MLLRTVMYASLDYENYVQTRVRMYKMQKIKSSVTLLPDTNSAEQHIRRSDYQAYIWQQCVVQDIQYHSLQGRGWKESNTGVHPQWFTCPKFPQILDTSVESTSTPGSLEEPPAKICKRDSTKSEPPLSLHKAHSSTDDEDTDSSCLSNNVDDDSGTDSETDSDFSDV